MTGQKVQQEKTRGKNALNVKNTSYQNFKEKLFTVEFVLKIRSKLHILLYAKIMYYFIHHIEPDPLSIKHSNIFSVRLPIYDVIKMAASFFSNWSHLFTHSCCINKCTFERLFFKLSKLNYY